MPLPQQFEQPEPRRAPEVALSPEQREAFEQKARTREQREQPVTVRPYQPPQPPRPLVRPTPEAALQQSVERVLEENLADVYRQLPPERQAQFRRKGEETARAITQLMQSAKLAVQKVLQLIKNWLKVIPGVNRFYLEQEAKIKSDRIMALYRQRQGGE